MYRVVRSCDETELRDVMSVCKLFRDTCSSLSSQKVTYLEAEEGDYLKPLRTRHCASLRELQLRYQFSSRSRHYPPVPVWTPASLQGVTRVDVVSSSSYGNLESLLPNMPDLKALHLQRVLDRDVRSGEEIVRSTYNNGALLAAASPRLRSLSVPLPADYAEQSADLAAIAGFRELTALRIDHLCNLVVISTLTNLRALSFRCSHVGNGSLRPLLALNRLTKLEITYGRYQQFQDLEAMQELPELVALRVDGEVDSYAFLAGFHQLTSLSIMTCDGDRNAQLIAKLPHLKELQLQCAWERTAMPGTSPTITHLRVLSLSWMTSRLTQLTTLAGLRSLEIGAGHQRSLMSEDAINDLTTLTALTELRLPRYRGSLDVVKLTALTSLRILEIWHPERTFGTAQLSSEMPELAVITKAGHFEMRRIRENKYSVFLC